MLRTAFATVLALALLAGCGSKDEKPAATQGGATENNFQGGRCGDRVARDYREVSFRCDRDQLRSRENMRACRRVAEEFLAKYPGVDCLATSRKHGTNHDHGARRDYRIEAREIREILERLERMGF